MCFCASLWYCTLSFECAHHEAPQLRKTCKFKKSLSLTKGREHSQNSLGGCGSTEQMPQGTVCYFRLHVILSHVRYQPVANISC